LLSVRLIALIEATDVASLNDAGFQTLRDLTNHQQKVAAGITEMLAQMSRSIEQVERELRGHQQQELAKAEQTRMHQVTGQLANDAGALLSRARRIGDVR
jgi:exonuclease VII large subunit